jgi:hypothetical protein
MATCAEVLHLMEACADKERFGVALGHYMRWRGSNSAITPCPVDDEQLAAWLEYPLDLGDKPVAVLDLKKSIRKYRPIHCVRLQLRSAELFYISPNRLDIPEVLTMRRIRYVVEYVFVNVDGVDATRMSDYVRSRQRIMSRTRAELGDLRSIAQSHLQDIRLRISKVHCPKNNTKGRPEGRPLRTIVDGAYTAE